MDLDKYWYRGGVAKDVYDDLIRKELDLHYYREYSASKSLTPLRRRIIDWMLDVNRQLDENRFIRRHANLNLNRVHSYQSCLRSVHLAVYLLDFFLHQHAVTYEHVYLFASSALIIAAKFELVHCHVPLPKLLNHFVQAEQRRTYCLADFRRAERMILKSLDWHFHVPLPLDFINYYLLPFENVDAHSAAYCRSSSCAATATPDHVTSPPPPDYPYSPLLNAHASCRYPTPSPEPSELEFSNWKNLAEVLINFTLKYVSFRQFKPSLIAGAAICTARFYYRIEPFWTKKLREISNHHIDDINACSNHMIGLVENERRHNPTAFPSSFNEVFGFVNSIPFPLSTHCRWLETRDLLILANPSNPPLITVIKLKRKLNEFVENDDVHTICKFGRFVGCVPTVGIQQQI